ADVYVVRVSVGKKIYRGVANVGYAPTFSRKKLVVEAHLFDL
ncbi:MAG: riboflavin biosynthesis protein RibF, partial [Deltaproteobacteria bacterium]|nr:riboflavin biosynthesis protein RibF [Deltaproteobacteria bacterium]